MNLTDLKEYCWKYADTYDYLEHVMKMPPCIIVCAVNGGVQGKEYNPAIPETADEVAESVYGAYKAGASMVHIHARNPEKLWGAATEAKLWLEVNSKVRAKCPDIIINNTTGGGLDSTMEDRLSCLDANPEVASLNLVPDMSKYKMKARDPPLLHPHPELSFDETTPFSYENISQFAQEMKNRGIKPEMETYHPGGAWVINDLVQQELVEKPYWIQTVMGYQTSSYPTVENVIHLLKELPEDSIWLCSGIGPHQLPMTTFAIILGGHVRVGLEDNIYYNRGELAKSNAQLVERAARITKELNREVATPTQARKMLGLSQKPSQY